ARDGRAPGGSDHRAGRARRRTPADRRAAPARLPARRVSGGGGPLLTIGHSNRPIDELLDLLGAHGVEEIADVRRFPRSRRYPHFNETPLAASLAAAGIGYRHWPEL